MADERQSLQRYVGDMLALERHVRVPFEMQARDGDFGRYANAAEMAERLAALSASHVDGLVQCLETLGGDTASPVKSAIAQIEGLFAGAIEEFRKTKVSKALRDDYTALALCCAGYTMLQTTASALGDDSVAALALRHLKDYAQCVLHLGDSLPDVVLAELRDSGLSMDTSASESMKRSIQEAWHRVAPSDYGTTATTDVASTGTGGRGDDYTDPGNPAGGINNAF